MEMDLQNIISKIKQEGVDEAEKQAQDLIAQARKKAAEIEGRAKKDSDAMLQKAAREAEKIKVSGEEAVRQAARDVILTLKDSIIRLFGEVLKAKVSESMTPDVMKDVIVKLADTVSRDGGALEVLVGEKDEKQLGEALKAALNEKMGSGMTIKVSRNVESGFRVGLKGKEAYYDFTDEAVAEALKTFLNPKINEMLSKAVE
ncbi:MAG: hypothetical protein PHH49_05205 [Candidatus Omnitrophica bacterium]|nr:hypothetical protein [Candidatus Omnitrophota bacterium]MDD5488339.1 hypothetical protein [Candidatus Omnitrophota bacterium]